MPGGVNSDDIDLCEVSRRLIIVVKMKAQAQIEENKNLELFIFLTDVFCCSCVARNRLTGCSYWMPWASTMLYHIASYYVNSFGKTVTIQF